ncbi:hypothetical protein PAHAL_3G340100 [Panicum hallii]|jgi:hypothetical protein|uniref:Uncharacterized protein n=1 Tax=Panicum hallii TaxID=206008 RepID=A0A2S3HD51_9POAL|nr:hypothetical protein PAHAL_3G340100 [Panicum hallii]
MAKIVEGLGHGAGFAKRRPAALLNSLPLFLRSFLHRFCRDAFSSGSYPGGELNAELAERPRRRPPPKWGSCREVGRSASTARRRLHAYLAVGPAPKTSTDPVAPATSAHGGCECEFGRSASTARQRLLASLSIRPRRRARLPRRRRPRLTWGHGCREGRSASTARQRLPTSAPAWPQRQARLPWRQLPAIRWSARGTAGTEPRRFIPSAP